MKLKDKLIEQQQLEFELELAYKEWIKYNYTPPSEKELDEMERDFSKSLTARNRIITHKPLNNTSYNPIYTA